MNYSKDVAYITQFNKAYCTTSLRMVAEPLQAILPVLRKSILMVTATCSVKVYGHAVDASVQEGINWTNTNQN